MKMLLVYAVFLVVVVFNVPMGDASIDTQHPEKNINVDLARHQLTELNAVIKTCDAIIQESSDAITITKKNFGSEELTKTLQETVNKITAVRGDMSSVQLYLQKALTQKKVEPISYEMFSDIEDLKTSLAFTLEWVHKIKILEMEIERLKKDPSKSNNL